MGFISPDEILNADDRQFVDVEVPEWNGTVRLMELTGDDADRFSTYAQKNNGDVTGIRAFLVGLCLVREDGKRMFSDDAVERKLGKKSGAVLGRLFQKAAELNGLSAAAQAELDENFD